MTLHMHVRDSSPLRVRWERLRRFIQSWTCINSTW